MPDKKMKEKYMSRFSVLLYLTGVIEDFGDEYIKRNGTNPIDVKTFSITDADYADFVEMAEKRDIPYKSEARVALEKMRSALAKEGDKSLDASLDAIEKGLKDDKLSNLQKYRKEITEQINENIVLRHAYAAGVVRHSLHNDEEVKAAVELLRNNEEYTRIVTKQDTARK
jgi:carboxyl-terminal processing protease